ILVIHISRLGESPLIRASCISLFTEGHDDCRKQDREDTDKRDDGMKRAKQKAEQPCKDDDEWPILTPVHGISIQGSAIHALSSLRLRSRSHSLPRSPRASAAARLRPATDAPLCGSDSVRRA